MPTLPGRREIRFYLANAGAGALALFAFAPFHIFPLVMFSLGVLFWSLLPRHGLSAFRLGYSFGLGFFGAGVPWVYVSMSQFGGVGGPLAAFLTLGFILFLSLYPALAGVLARRLPAPGDGLRLIVLYPAVWVLVEWLRGWLFTGFPWLNIGYSQTDFLLRGYGPLFGVYGISLAVAVITGLAVFIVMHRRQRLPLRRAFTAIAVLLTVGTVALLIPWTRDTGRTLSATMVQGNVSQDRKWLPEQRQPTIETYFSHTLGNWDSELVIWPETAMPFYYHQGEKVFRTLGELAVKEHTDILFGVPYLDPDTGGVYNSLASVGSSEQLYHKRHLVPFGEYLPMKDGLGKILDLLRIPMSDFSAGRGEPRNLRLAGEPMAVSICYEDAFGEEVIEYLPEATVLINASNDAWFGESYSPHQHLQMARMRSIETGRQMLRVTNTGVTALIDHDGRIIDRLPQFRTAALTVTVRPHQGSTPYVFWGNWPALMLCLAGILWSWRRTRSRGES